MRIPGLVFLFFQFPGYLQLPSFVVCTMDQIMKEAHGWNFV